MDIKSIEAFEINDIAFYGIESIEHAVKGKGIVHTVQGVATRDHKTKTFSVDVDELSIVDTEDFRKDLYQAVDVAMRHDH